MLDTLARSCRNSSGVLVEYGPGGYSPGHTHAKSAFIYATVLEGAIRSKVNDGPVTTYQAGQSFSELPGDRHGVSANASETKPATPRGVGHFKALPINLQAASASVLIGPHKCSRK